MAGGILVAGVGNIFLGDDGFGPEVVRRFAAGGYAHPRVRVVDYGIRGMHLAYDLLVGYDALVLVDAVPGGQSPPGTLSVLQIGREDLGAGDFDAHGMNPVAVLASLDTLGGSLPPTYLVGCCPASLDENLGLSATVASVIDEAVDLTSRLVDDLLASAETAPCSAGGDAACALESPAR